jgi:hypothetical protein
MISDSDLAKLRFGMTDVPLPGGRPGDYEERLTQWFLERSFFRDFTYRNPAKKKGEELADAVVLFDDVAFLVQVKAQHGNHEAKAWATETILKALKQVRATHDNLVTGKVKSLTNEVYGKLQFDPQHYPNVYGIIILAQRSSDPFDSLDLVPELKETSFPVFVFSLADIELISKRFDTGADFVHFIELRTDTAAHASYSVNDEERNLMHMVQLAPAVYKRRMQPISEEMLARTVEAFREKASGELASSSDWRYGLAIDDMIARAHDVDPNLEWNTDGVGVEAKIARYLGWLSRDRRIRLGRRMLAACIESEGTGQPEFFTHYQRSRGTVGVYLATSETRADRVERLKFLVTYARFKYQVGQAFGVATDAGTSGSAYDFMLTNRDIPESVIEHLKTIDDPFTNEMSPL